MATNRDRQFIDQDYGLPVSAIKDIIKSHDRSGNALMIVGPTGVGKTYAVLEAGEELGCYDIHDENRKPDDPVVMSIMGSTLDPTDVQGIPYPDWDNRVTRKLPDSMFMVPDWSLLFFDEMNRAIQQTQDALLRVIHEGRFGEFILPPHVLVVGAANPPDRQHIVHQLSAPMKDRFTIVHVKAEKDGWIEWAIQHGVHPLVISFINQFGITYLAPPVPSDTTKNLEAFPTPRAWEATGKIMYEKYRDAGLGLAIRNQKIIGTVGPKAGGEFIAYAEIGSRLPAANDVLDGRVSFPRDASLLYATQIAVTQLLMDRINKEQPEDTTALENLMNTMDNPKMQWPPEIMAIIAIAIKGSAFAQDKFFQFAFHNMKTFDSPVWQTFRDAHAEN